MQSQDGPGHVAELITEFVEPRGFPASISNVSEVFKETHRPLKQGREIVGATPAVTANFKQRVSEHRSRRAHNPESRCKSEPRNFSKGDA